MIFAEIEYKSEEQAKILELPKWFGKDISNLITNLKWIIVVLVIY